MPLPSPQDNTIISEEFIEKLLLGNSKILKFECLLNLLENVKKKKKLNIRSFNLYHICYSCHFCLIYIIYLIKDVLCILFRFSRVK